MAKKKSESYLRERRGASKQKPMRNGVDKLQQEIRHLAQMRDEDIDTSDIPEVIDWSRAQVGRFYRPVKESVTVRIDADILSWVRSGGKGYQTRINRMLRVAMEGPDTSALDISEGHSDLHFPSLERHGQLERCNRWAQAIERRGSIFAASR